VPDLGLPAFTRSSSSAAPRVGHVAIALARSWSNALTASTGIVSVIGGPLATGRRRAIEQVIRTTAPMHDGFSGGAFLDTDGQAIGVTTAAKIRGLGVVIPAAIAWKTAATLLEHGSVKRGYLGIAAQPVRLPDDQRPAGHEAALLVVGVTAGSPAAASGVLVGDVILELDGHPLDSPEDLLDLLQGRAGQTAALKVLRGGKPVDVGVVVGERPDAG
jgi:S1-C subfamily serine protease